MEPAIKEQPAALQVQDLTTGHFLPEETLGAIAHAVIGEQYRRMVKQGGKVLEDKDPEHLHQMRVANRRLRTALHVFEQAIELPEAGSIKRVGALGKVLGKLRDLDVQLATLEIQYRPNLSHAEQETLDVAIASLQKQRRKTFANTKELLNQSRYQSLKESYDLWLQRPIYQPLARLPLRPLLPDLLSPLLSTLLLHPGWLVSVNDLNEENAVILHELRKACKHVRYQTEFFMPFYGDRFQTWVGEIKTLQDRLGQLQDTQVLQELLHDELPAHAELPGFQRIIRQQQQEALVDWESVRQKYLDQEFRYGLHHMLLEPIAI